MNSHVLNGMMHLGIENASVCTVYAVVVQYVAIVGLVASPGS